MFFFSKMQATGNDFIIVNNLENKFEYSFKLLSKFLCDRHFGVGADGVLILDNGNETKYRMRIFNQDGTEAEMCGNGIRCFAKYLYEKNIIKNDEIEIETLSGIKKIKLIIEGNTVVFVQVDMEKPILNFSSIPVYYEDTDNTYLQIENLKVYPISMGNPHAVCFVENIENFDIESVGNLIENYKYFPNKTNVEFVQIKNENTIKVRVWERGVGETLSCGTGACAAAVISNLYKSTESELTVELKGGNLRINYDGEKVIMQGSAEFVYEGEMNI